MNFRINELILQKEPYSFIGATSQGLDMVNGSLTNNLNNLTSQQMAMLENSRYMHNMTHDPTRHGTYKNRELIAEQVVVADNLLPTQDNKAVHVKQ